MTLLNPQRATIIRTHDRMLFKKCRILWDYQSPNRHNYTTVRPSLPLVMGTAIHAGLEYWYKPEFQGQSRLLVYAESIAIFVETLKREINGEYPEDIVDELIVLGRAMLQHYFQYYENEHEDWEITHTEIPFSVPIPLDTVGVKAYDNVSFTSDPVTGKYILAELVNVPGLGKVPQPVMYEGQLDLIPLNRATGKLWVFDHKTTERLDIDGLSYLDLDDQVNAYYWVAHQALGLDVDGVIFNYLKKVMPPTKPKLISKGRALSKDNSQRTTVELYKEAIEENGFDPLDYVEFLENYQEPTYFHREEVAKKTKDLRVVEQNIVTEARAIIGGGDNLYPSPNLLNCRGCPFQFPCKMRQRGEDDIQWIESSGLFKRNTSYGKPIDEQSIPA